MKKTNARFYTTGQIAVYCGVSFRTVIRWIEKGYMQANRLPGRGDYRVKSSELREFLKKNEMEIPDDLVLKDDSKNKTALVVDDDPITAKLISRKLKKLGFDTYMATDGFQAGYILQQVQPDIMTLDLLMEGVDGFGVLKLIQKDRTHSKMKILVISSSDSTGLKRALKEGAHEVMNKPVHPKEFEAKVKFLTE